MLLKPYCMWLLDVNDKSKREIDSVICGQVKSFRGHWLLCLKSRSPVEKAWHDECGVVGFIFKLSLRYYRELKQRRGRRQRERQKKTTTKGLDRQNNNPALPSLFFAHSCATTTWNYLISRYFGGHEHKTTTLFCFSWTLIQSFRIQLQTNSPIFDELNEMEYTRSLNLREHTF